MTDDVRGEGIAYNKRDFFFLVGSTGLQATALSLFCDFMWMKEHAELLCAQPSFWWNGENILGHPTRGRRLPGGISRPNSLWFSPKSDGKRTLFIDLEVKFGETRHPAQPGSANGGWMWDVRRSDSKNPLWIRCIASGSLLLGAQAGTDYNAAQSGTFTVRRFAGSLSPALARWDVCVDLGLVPPLLVLSFAPAPSRGRTPLSWCSSILHPLQWGCTKSFTIPPTQTQSSLCADTARNTQPSSRTGLLIFPVTHSKGAIFHHRLNVSVQLTWPTAVIIFCWKRDLWKQTWSPRCILPCTTMSIPMCINRWVPADPCCSEG